MTPKDSETQATEERERFKAEFGQRPGPEMAFEQNRWDENWIAFSAGWQARASEGDGELVKVLLEAIQEAIDIIPGSMGGHVTLGLNILQRVLARAQNGNGMGPVQTE